VSPDDTALTFGPFRVDAAGGLAPIEPAAPPRFTFRWRDRLVHASLQEGEVPAGSLRLRAQLGRVPSSALPPEAARRPQSFTLLRSLPATLPQDWRVGLTPDHRVVLEAECHVALPITATGLVGEVTGFLLRLAPYLDVLDEVGLATSPEAAGRVNTCPG
jgi:hypothetical protein